MVNTLQKLSLKFLPSNRIHMVRNGNKFRFIVNINKNRSVNVSNKNLTRNQLRNITSRLKKNNLEHRVFSMRNNVNNANSLEKYINTFRILYPTNNLNAAPLLFHVRRIHHKLMTRNMRNYKPYKNLMKNKTLNKNNFKKRYRKISSNYNANKRQIHRIYERLTM